MPPIKQFPAVEDDEQREKIMDSAERIYKKYAGGGTPTPDEQDTLDWAQGLRQQITSISDIFIENDDGVPQTAHQVLEEDSLEIPSP